MDDDEGLPYSWAWKEPIAEDEPGPTEANYVAKPGKYVFLTSCLFLRLHSLSYLLLFLGVL